MSETVLLNAGGNPFRIVLGCLDGSVTSYPVSDGILSPVSVIESKGF